MSDDPGSAGPEDRSPRSLHRFLRWLIFLRGSPEAIALGLATGVFVAFTPTVGLQIIIAAFLATLIGANRPAAIMAVWITNPLTIPPLYGFTYWVGSGFVRGPPLSRVREVLERSVGRLERHDVWEVHDRFVSFLELGREIFIPLCIGGVLVGLVSGSLSYLIALPLIRSGRRRLQRVRRRPRPTSGPGGRT